MSSRFFSLEASICALSTSLALAAGDAWQPKQGQLKTRWAKEVSPTNAHPEYPRPQMVRPEWLNLNGLWDYAITSTAAPPQRWDGKILVPFPVESALSGVMQTIKDGQQLWYRRTFNVPTA